MITSVGQDVEKTEPSFIGSRMQNGSDTLENSLTVPQRVKHKVTFSSVQFSSVTQLCPTLCDPMNSSMPGLPVHHQLPEFTQTHVHWVSDAIQPSHPRLSPSPPAPNPSQHQSLDFFFINPPKRDPHLLPCDIFLTWELE